jgi:hypothetical protein
LAIRTASALVGFCFGAGAFLNFALDGIKGNTGVCTFEAASIGCVVIGPVTGLFLDMTDNSLPSTSFKNSNLAGVNRHYAFTGLGCIF